MDKTRKLEIIESPSALNNLLSEFVIKKFDDGSKIDILEAGCGKRWELDLKGMEYDLTGVDIDGDGLELRKKEHNDLNTTMLGDLRTVELEEAKFDVIYNSYVIEHIQGAEKVLNNFLRWSKPGGVIILKFPDRDSVFGFLTRVSPHWLHILYKRHIQGVKKAGRPGCGPFPTVYDKVVSRAGMHKYCDEHEVNILCEYGTNYYLDKSPKVAMLAKPILKLIEIMSFGKLKSDHNNLVYILEKK